MRWSRAAMCALVVIVGLGLAACEDAGSPAPPGISRDAAIAIARNHVGPDATYALSRAGPYSQAYVPSGGDVPPPSPGRWVWVITFASTVAPCPPLFDATCMPPRPATIQVVLDYATGAFESSSAVAPAP